jgi:hypothetical protein
MANPKSIPHPAPLPDRGGEGMSRARTAQQARKHRHTFLREKVRQVFDVLALLQDSNLES